MNYRDITLKIENKIATITLNRPERLNAASLDMADEISDALDHLGDTRCLIITGAGRAFCSGADLKASNDEPSLSGGDASYRALTLHFNPMIMKLMRLDLPTVVAVNGAAAGIGCSIGLCGDFVIAGKSGYFLQSFVNVGLVPDGGASWILPRLIGPNRATEMMMLGEKISGKKAAEWGLIYKCVVDEDLEAETLALATRLANGPTICYANTRKNIMAAFETSYAAQLSAEAEFGRQNSFSAEALEEAASLVATPEKSSGS